MTCLEFLFVCWCSSILAVTRCIRVNGFSCVSAYWNTIACVINITGIPVGPSITYNLTFTENKWKTMISSPLVIANHSNSYVCKVENTKNFTRGINYSINFCCKSDCQLLRKSFQPSKNIQLTPPRDIEVQQTPEAFNVTWKSGYEGHSYLKGFLDYELLLQKSQSSESKIIKVRKTFEPLPRLQLDTYGTSCIKVRSIPNVPNNYFGTWSKWSPLSCWKNANAQEEQENILVILTKSLGSVCLVAVVLLVLFYCPAARMKIKTLSHTPSPASFFQPLYKQHDGNLQEWLSPESKFVLTYKTEEILITDAVTVVPKPITKDPEENQVFQSPSVTQVILPQCQTSYVGLPGMHEASQPITMVCPGATSYTQLPCSVWGFGIGEVQFVSSPPEDFLEISHADSGCSCEDLTQSLECSLPNSPENESSPPCYCSDYCILNKTAEGVVPVLVTK